MSNDSYPLTSATSGVAGTCAYNRHKVIARIQADPAPAYQFVVKPCLKGNCRSQAYNAEKDLRDYVANYGPVSVCLNASGKNGTVWQYYTKGVVAGSVCSGASDQMNHCAQLVGYVVRPNGRGYWLVRNQWGSNWGMNGQIRLQLNANTCGISNYATVPLVA